MNECGSCESIHCLGYWLCTDVFLVPLSDMAERFRDDWNRLKT